MNFIHSKTGEEGRDALEKIIAGHIREENVLWLICGGSNIPIAVSVMDSLRKSESSDTLHNLTVMQTDERYGPVGHKDSNWQQMIDAGFPMENISTVPVLTGASEQETVSAYNEAIGQAFESADYIVGLFGIGGDGHIAGILPHSPALQAPGLVTSYEAAPFTRVTLTPEALRHLDDAVALVFGETKCEALTKLAFEPLSIEEEPAQILKEIPHATLYSDCL